MKVSGVFFNFNFFILINHKHILQDYMLQNLDQNQPQATPQIIIDDSKQQSIQIVVEPLSKARYKIGEELVRLPLPIVATGETGLVSGTISID